ncbi:MAG: recombination mediator RecR [Candidatus Omnitrophica bacterium]|nr:recombination mediator RecR [Candidatus Omnitrophota bacterium]
MYGYPKLLEKLIEELSKLPTIGPKSAERMALYLLRTDAQQAKSLAEAVVNAREHTRKCKVCNYFAEDEICPICQERPRRDKVICVVEDPQDVIAIERTGRFKGVYHVLWGKLSPLEGTGPDDLPLKKLLSRIQEEKIGEIIIATSSGREGETTAQYLRQLLKPLNVKMTRIARGMPMGSTIGYIDQATISEALEGRREVSA